MSLPHKRQDRNVFAAGITRGGKTVTMNEMHAEFNGLSVFWNPEEEDNIVGYMINKPSHIITAIEKFGWNVKLDYRPRYTSDSNRRDEIAQLQQFLFDLANETGRVHPIQLCVDECQDVAQQGKGSGGLHKLVKKGLKRKIKVVSGSQDPATVSKTIVRQCDYNLWCGGFNPYYQDYFDTYNLPTERIKKQEQGDVTVFEGAEPIGEYRAAARYA